MAGLKRRSLGSGNKNKHRLSSKGRRHSDNAAKSTRPPESPTRNKPVEVELFPKGSALGADETIEPGAPVWRKSVTGEFATPAGQRTRVPLHAQNTPLGLRYVSIGSDHESVRYDDSFSRYYYRDDTEEEPVEPIGFFESLKADLAMIEPATKENNPMLTDNVFNFARVPIQLEQVLFHGFFMCLDSLLFMVTYLPIRVVRAVVLLMYTGTVNMWKLHHKKSGSPKGVKTIPALLFHRTQLYDLIRGVTLVIALYALLQVQMSQIYHFVRGQSFIKLYVIFNMLDIFDRLFCTFGQDIVDSLYWITRYNPQDVLGIFARFLVCLCYTVAHSYLYFLRLITLNAAINSESTALLTVLLSNNFVELKGSVFKRYAEQNLFQITCSDIVERFELCIFLLLTGMQSKTTWSEFLFGSAAYICASELVVDWIKHIFITKFNRLDTSVYGNYREALSRDLAPRGGTKDPYPHCKRMVDHTQAVAQRIGLATLPLTCVVLRFVWVAIPYDIRDDPFATKHAVVVILCFLNLLAIKILLNTLLKGSCCRYLMSRERSLYRVVSPRGPVTSKEKAAHREVLKKHMDHIDNLSGIRRYMIYKSRVPT